MLFELKAIGESGSKKPCWPYLKDLNERDPLNEAFYGMPISFQKLSRFEDRDFGRISYKKLIKLTF